MQKYVILHNIRSAHNVGSIFRTADGAGVAKIYLTGYTPAPTDRFGREQPEIKKTSLGAVKSVTWEKRDNIIDVVAELRANSVDIIAVEQATNAISYKKFEPKESIAFIFGSETEGIELDTLVLADHVIEIPMQGTKESLNVSVAAGIILFTNEQS